MHTPPAFSSFAFGKKNSEMEKKKKRIRIHVCAIARAIPCITRTGSFNFFRFARLSSRVKMAMVCRPFPESSELLSVYSKRCCFVSSALKNAFVLLFFAIFSLYSHVFSKISAY